MIRSELRYGSFLLLMAAKDFKLLKTKITYSAVEEYVHSEEEIRDIRAVARDRRRYNSRMDDIDGNS